MNENTNRIIDRLTLPALGLPATVLMFEYTNNQYPSKILTVLLIFAMPFAIAAFIWLGWRFLSILPKGEGTNCIIDWLTLIPLGYLPALAVWGHYAHINQPSTIWLVLGAVDVPLALTSFIWLGLRADKIKLVHWFVYDIAMVPHRAILFVLSSWGIVILVRWLWS